MLNINPTTAVFAFDSICKTEAQRLGYLERSERSLGDGSLSSMIFSFFKKVSPCKRTASLLYQTAVAKVSKFNN